MKSVKLTLITSSGERVFFVEDFEGAALIRPRGVVRSLAGRDVTLLRGTGESPIPGVSVLAIRVEIDE